MLVEMLLQKGTPSHTEEYIGANEDYELYKGKLVFMIIGLNNTGLMAIKACP